jgi:hypothetical protein
MKLFIAVSFLCLLVMSGSALCQEAEPVDSLLIGLPCITVWVDSLSAALEEEGIRRDALCDTIAHGLQSAGIEVVDADTIGAVPGAPTLVLHLDVLLQAGIAQVCYSVRLELTETVCLERDESVVARRVPTWGRSSMGLVAGGWKDDLIKDVLLHAEAFRDEFLAANPRTGSPQ